jgi:cobalt-zinc-cadmium efflux system outer membrane protein
MMKTTYIAFALLLLGSGICLGAPSEVYPTSDSLMKTIREHNRTLQTAWETYQVAMLQAGTGNTPPDPEVELGYLYGSPTELGNRVDFSVTQQVDFPTAYIYKSRLRKIRTSQAELDYIIVRQQVMLQAKQLWIEHIYLNQRRNLLEKRLFQANTINEHFKQKLESGEVSHLAYSQSNLQLASIRSEFDQVLMEIRNTELTWTEISGGIDVEIKDTIFPLPIEIIPDSVLNVYQNSPHMLRYSQELQSKEEEKKLAVSETLPKLKAGYYSESVLDIKFKGFQVGITVPLWENSNRIKHAKSEISFAQQDAQRFTNLQQRKVKQNLEQLESLRTRTRVLEEALGTGRSLELLALSLENGEISMSEYFYASDFYFQNQQLLLQYKRDLLVQEAELLKVYL